MFYFLLQWILRKTSSSFTEKPGPASHHNVWWRIVKTKLCIFILTWLLSRHWFLAISEKPCVNPCVYPIRTIRDLTPPSGMVQGQSVTKIWMMSFQYDVFNINKVMKQRDYHMLESMPQFFPHCLPIWFILSLPSCLCPVYYNRLQINMNHDKSNSRFWWGYYLSRLRPVGLVLLKIPSHLMQLGMIIHRDSEQFFLFFRRNLPTGWSSEY